jgi:hypothetical protein
VQHVGAEGVVVALKTGFCMMLYFSEAHLTQTYVEHSLSPSP